MCWLNKSVRALFISLTLLLWPIAVFLSLLTNPLVFSGTIFVTDYQKQQEIVRKTYLYPNVIMARAFQNKALIPIAKFEENLTALLDPNNYFFGFHPREMGHNLNMIKFPFVSLPLFVIGLLNLIRGKKGKLFLITLTSFILVLSLLSAFDRFDLILYPLLVAVFIRGVSVLEKKHQILSYLYYFFSLPPALIIFLRQVIIYTPK